MRRLLAALLCGFAPLLLPASAHAQALSGYDRTASDSRLRIGDNHWKLVGGVELERGDTKIFADQIEVFLDEQRAVASGNVTFTQAANRISADRADFNIKTRLGTFYNATGIATFQPPRQGQQTGITVTPRAGQDSDVYFFGETIEKIGPKKYRITNGGFSTCVQPTPRWDLHAGTVVLNVDHYTMLRHAQLRVKGVPLLYLPIIYYPTKKEGRATGFLMPTYGSSTLRGQELHNGFFWAIDRSQDATFMHEFFSQIGQGLSSEYRYNFGGGSDGNLNVHFLNQQQSTYPQPNGTTRIVPASRSFELRGGMNQMLPGNLRARANVNYFSNIVTNQTFNTNVVNASTNNRSYGGNVVGTWSSYRFNGTFDRSEYFYNTTTSALTGGAPRLSVARNERPLFGSPVYVSATGEYAGLLSERKTGAIVVDSGVTRLDFTPQVRFPFKKWQWFTVNSSLSWRNTFYSRSLDARRAVIDDNLNRRYFALQAQMVGPIFNKIWDTPGSGYAEKYKHTIEPFLTLERTSSIDNYAHIVQLESADYVIGGVTRYTYGVINRVYAKRRQATGPGLSREIFNAAISQTYSTDQNSAQYDLRYVTSFSGQAPSHFTPVAVSASVTPSTSINATLRAEIDARHRSLRTISATGTYSWTSRVTATGGWSKRFFIRELTGFNNPAYLTHYLNASTTVHTEDNRVGGTYSFNFDLLNSSMLQQRFSGYYNAQCCGIALEYQTYNFGGLQSSVPVSADHRFFLSVTLAGLGNFSPFNGALSGVPR